MSFEWQTDDARDWEQGPLKDPGDAGPKRVRLLIPGLLALLGILLLLGWQIKARVAAGVAGVEADVVASHQLLWSAAGNGDQELFQSLLSGRDTGWAAALSATIARGAYHDRSAFGLTFLTANGGWPPVEVTLAPDLRSAELVWDAYYQVDIGNGLTETVRLRQSEVFRQGPGRWLLAPPDPPYWGTFESVRGHRVLMHFPARDEAVARRLALDIDSKLAALCSAEPDLRCGSGLLLNLLLSTDPASFQRFGEAMINAQSDINQTLPAPSLVGMPQDETGYQALFRGYASLATESVVQRLLGQACCQQTLAQEALLARLLAKLGLRSGDLASSAYRQLYESRVTLADVGQIWTGQGSRRDAQGDKEAMLAFVHFAAERAEMKLVRALRLLQAEPGFWEWLQQSNPGLAAGYDLWDQQFQQFVAEKAGSTINVTSWEGVLGGETAGRSASRGDKVWHENARTLDGHG